MSEEDPSQKMESEGCEQNCDRVLEQTSETAQENTSSSEQGQPSFPERTFEGTPRSAVYGARHLTPCTLEEYLDLPNIADDRYELVEGVLVLRDMPSVDHDTVRDYLVAAVQVLYARDNIQVRADAETSVQIPRVKFSKASIRGEKSPSPHSSPRSSSTSSSSPSSQESREPSTRHPDVAVSRYSSRSQDKANSPRSKKIRFPEDKPPLLIVEVTSLGSRSTDLNEKWIEYARAEVQEYMIVDRQKNRVIVGNLRGTDARTCSGDPDAPTRRATRSPSQGGGSIEESLVLYSRRVFTKGEVVKCSYFQNLGMTAKEILDPEKLGQDLIKRHMKELKEEIDRLRSTNEGLRSTNEGLRSTNEGLRSTNEGLRSTVQSQGEELKRSYEKIKELERQAPSASTQSSETRPRGSGHQQQQPRSQLAPRTGPNTMATSAPARQPEREQRGRNDHDQSKGGAQRDDPSRSRQPTAKRQLSVQRSGRNRDDKGNAGVGRSHPASPEVKHRGKSRRH